MVTTMQGINALQLPLICRFHDRTFWRQTSWISNVRYKTKWRTKQNKIKTKWIVHIRTRYYSVRHKLTAWKAWLAFTFMISSLYLFSYLFCTSCYPIYSLAPDKSAKKLIVLIKPIDGYVVNEIKILDVKRQNENGNILYRTISLLTLYTLVYN